MHVPDIVAFCCSFCGWFSTTLWFSVVLGIHVYLPADCLQTNTQTPSDTELCDTYLARVSSRAMQLALDLHISYILYILSNFLWLTFSELLLFVRPSLVPVCVHVKKMVNWYCSILSWWCANLENITQINISVWYLPFVWMLTGIFTAAYGRLIY